MNRTILIVGIDYWPDLTGPAPYTTQFAEYLAEQGDDVHVITGMPYYPEWKIKHGYDRKLRLIETRNGVTIHRRRQYIPRQQTALQRAGYEGTFLLQSLLLPKIPKPDQAIGVIPALADGLLAARFAKKDDVPLSIWIQDLMGQAATQSGVPGGQKIAKHTARMEGWIAKQARSVGIVSSGFQPHLEAMGVPTDRIHVTPNWAHIAEPTMSQNEARNALELPSSRVICLHAGNMGLKQGLDNIVEAARIATTLAPDLFFVLLGDGSQRRTLEQLGHGLPNLRFVDPVSDAMFPNALVSADYLLLCQKSTITDMSMPSKLTSYQAAGRPIVATISEGTPIASHVQSLGGTIVDPESPLLLIETLASIESKLHSNVTPPPTSLSALQHLQATLLPSNNLSQGRS